MEKSTTKLFKVITLNETRTILMFVQLTLGQLQEVFPKYIVRILTHDRFHLPKDTKVKNYIFRSLHTDSTMNYVVEIELTRFVKLFENDSYHLCRKNFEQSVSLPEPETPTSLEEKPLRVGQSTSHEEQPTTTHNSGGTNKTKEKPSYYEGITRFLKYSLTYCPGHRLYNSQRHSKLCA